MINGKFIYMSHSNLTEGKILDKIVKVSLPIMGSSFGVMAYNITDMYWLGHLGSQSVAAVGVSGLITWFVGAFLSFLQTGVEVNVAQSVGAGNIKRAERFARNGIYLALLLGGITCLIISVFAHYFISLFGLAEVEVVEQATIYLRIFSFGVFASISMNAIGGIYNGIGRSKIPFAINMIGLIGNTILDPLFIFTFKLGVVGAALATVISHGIAFLVYIYVVKVARPPFENFSFAGRLSKEFYGKIIKIGMPPALHYASFSIFASIIARIVSKWGATPIAVQSLGAQIESISWMTASGFATALSAFVGQNFGAKKFERILSGIKLTMLLSCSFGIFSTFLLAFFGENIYRVFMPEEESIRLGSKYLMIMAYSQVFMSIEITIAGAFRGLGNTLPPSLVGIIFTGARIPLALLLCVPWELPGIWWSITFTSIAKGTLLLAWFVLWYKRYEAKRLSLAL